MAELDDKLISSRQRLLMMEIFGVALVVVGAIPAAGDFRLASLGASWYGVLIGLCWVAAGVLALRRRLAGHY